MSKLLEFIGVVVLAVLIALAVSLMVGFPIMWCWNYLMPDVFGLPTITFWQAVVMYFLSYMLFKNTSSTSKSSE